MMISSKYVDDWQMILHDRKDLYRGYQSGLTFLLQIVAPDRLDVHCTIRLSCPTDHRTECYYMASVSHARAVLACTGEPRGWKDTISVMRRQTVRILLGCWLVDLLTGHMQWHGWYCCW